MPQAAPSPITHCRRWLLAERIAQAFGISPSDWLMVSEWGEQKVLSITHKHILRSISAVQVRRTTCSTRIMMIHVATILSFFPFFISLHLVHNGDLTHITYVHRTLHHPFSGGRPALAYNRWHRQCVCVRDLVREEKSDTFSWCCYRWLCRGNSRCTHGNAIVSCSSEWPR